MEMPIEHSKTRFMENGQPVRLLSSVPCGKDYRSYCANKFFYCVKMIHINIIMHLTDPFIQWKYSEFNVQFYHFVSSEPRLCLTGQTTLVLSSVKMQYFLFINKRKIKKTGRALLKKNCLKEG